MQKVIVTVGGGCATGATNHGEECAEGTERKNRHGDETCCDGRMKDLCMTVVCWLFVECGIVPMFLQQG